MKRFALVVFALAPLLLPGCFLAVIGAVAAIVVSQNRDPVAIQNGVAVREYSVSFDRAWSGVESALRANEVITEPATRGDGTASVRGRTKEGEPVEVTAERVNIVVRISIRVGQADTEPNRALAKAIHKKIDEDFCVVRRHYGQNFEPVWQAGQKVVPPDSKIQPDNTLGQIQGKKADGTPVVITIQRVDTSRTRITIEVGATANLDTQQQAVDLARAISKTLGIKSEEGD